MDRIQDNFPGSLTLSWYVEQPPLKTWEGVLGKSRFAPQVYGVGVQ